MNVVLTTRQLIELHFPMSERGDISTRQCRVTNLHGSRSCQREDGIKRCSGRRDDNCTANSRGLNGAVAPYFVFYDASDTCSVVDIALKLWGEQPWEDALYILDRAMAGYGADALEFEVEELQPPHPFAELIRLAFAPELSLGTRVLAPIRAKTRYTNPDLLSEAMHAEWHRTIMCFADRYGLWLPLEIGEDEDSNPM